MKTYQETTGSVRFHRVGDVEFWLTALNRVFLLVAGRPVFPSLKGSTVVKFDDPMFHPTSKVSEALLRILRRQREVRMDWPTPEEDEVAYAYS